LSNIRLTLPASMLVTFVLGSVHAFSVFIVPLETRLQLPRSEISLIYSFALVALTLAVLLGYAAGVNHLPGGRGRFAAGVARDQLVDDVRGL
jgi:hypothetical protein